MPGFPNFGFGFGSSSSRNESSCYYRVLAVARNASAEEIRTAYYRLAREYHPDRCRSGNSDEKMKAINKAYAILSDPAKRDCYDRGEREPSDDDGPSHGRMRPYGGCSTVHTASEPTRGGYQNMETVLVNSGLGDLFPPMRSTLVGGTVNYAVLHSMIDTELEECGLDFVRDAFWKAAAEKFQCRGCGHRIGSLNEVCYCREVAKMHCHCLNVCCTKVKGK